MRPEPTPLAAPWSCSLVDPFALHGAASGEDRLLTVAYGVDDNASTGIPPPSLAVPNRVLGDGPRLEVWHSARSIARFRRNGLEWAEDGNVLAGSLRRSSSIDLAAACRVQFGTLLDLAAERGYPHLLRVWNYLPGINRGRGDRERYRLFNVGRLRAFEDRFGARGAPRRFPASSAVGSPGDALRTVFLASKVPPQRIENPRQRSAFRYPRDYGPAPPSFCRATVAPAELDSALFLSGTASVVGHSTHHSGSLALQIEETLRNIDTLVAAARCRTARAIPGLGALDLVKVYLRRAEDFGAARALLAETLDASIPTLYLEADICRADLLVEIDGFGLS